MGCTIRKFKIRFAEHVLGIRNRQVHHSDVEKHFVEVHDGKMLWEPLPLNMFLSCLGKEIGEKLY